MITQPFSKLRKESSFSLTFKNKQSGENGMEWRVEAMSMTTKQPATQPFSSYDRSGWMMMMTMIPVTVKARVNH